MNITLVYNPKSGSSLSRQALRKKCDAANITIDKFVAIGDGFERKLSSAITADASIAVIGGDGTVSAVAGLVYSGYHDRRQRGRHAYARHYRTKYWSPTSRS